MIDDPLHFDRHWLCGTFLRTLHECSLYTHILDPIHIYLFVLNMMNDISYFDSCHSIWWMRFVYHWLPSLRLRYSHTLAPPPSKLKPKRLRFPRFDGLRVCVSHFSAENTSLPTVRQNQQKSSQKSAVSLPPASLLIVLYDSVHYLAVFSSYSYRIFRFHDVFFSFAAEFVCICFVIPIETWTQLDIISTASVGVPCYSSIQFISLKSYSFLRSDFLRRRHISIRWYLFFSSPQNGESFRCAGFFHLQHFGWDGLARHRFVISMKCLTPCDARTPTQIPVVENPPAWVIKWRVRSIVSLVKTDMRAE